MTMSISGILPPLGERLRREATQGRGRKPRVSGQRAREVALPSRYKADPYDPTLGRMGWPGA
ncbi:hypothetical protein PGT21_011985 [Puccinia graminis f. sp. tritici]|uniref:Uncharacterized protein n=1 Tax=Puccinia graminis f. sp. tritici TaxID=56615 RepID=A0A5B0QTA1_PUCGR|nr:hypothetical protein PGT21_011985 [Puccinia graminis f. sp. tritici]